MHVKEGDLLPPDSRCPLCREAGERTRVLLLQTEPDVCLLKCPKCGGHSASRLPTDETLRRYYGGYYEDSGNTVTCDDPLAFAQHVMAYARPLLKETAPPLSWTLEVEAAISLR